jgi:hypothetical protein
MFCYPGATILRKSLQLPLNVQQEMQVHQDIPVPVSV